MQRQLLLAITVAVVVGLIIGTVLTSGTSDACKQWQSDYERARQEAGTGVFGSINQGPLAERLQELEREKPDGCPVP